ncbi:MAG: hypothetical protein ACLGGX_03410 [Bdellovibrionia bacterium]
MKKVLGTLVTVLAFTSIANAECVLKVKRDACPGKEAEAYRPYMGKVETIEKKDAADEKACAKIAEDDSKIKRKGTLSGKSITATFGGKDLGKTWSDKAECK